MEGVSLLAGSLWLSWECWGLVELPRASEEQTEPRLPLGHSGFVLAWQGLPIPAKGSLVPPAPAARGFFPPPMWKSISYCHHTAPSALPGVSLAPPNFQGFLGSLFPPSMLREGFVFHSYLSLCRFVPVIAAVPGFPAGLLCRELQVGYEI